MVNNPNAPGNSALDIEEDIGRPSQGAATTYSAQTNINTNQGSVSDLLTQLPMGINEVLTRLDVVNAHATKNADLAMWRNLTATIHRERSGDFDQDEAAKTFEFILQHQP